MDGMLLIHKPAGISSFGVIEGLQRALLAHAAESGAPIKKRDLPKFGHGGTLDPFATGLLLVCVGEGTKLSRYFLGSRKEYRARMRFGATTIPGDPTAPVSETCEHVPQSLEDIRREAHRFTESPYQQIPPMHSAKKIDGKVLYELAREGIEVERKPVEVRIQEFEVVDYTPPLATIRVSCSAGTYIRVLGQDLGRRLGSLAYLETLERTASGKHRLETALALDEIMTRLRAGEPLAKLSAFIPFEGMLSGFPCMGVSSDEALKIRQGQTRVIDEFLAVRIPEFARLNEKNPEIVVFQDSEQQLLAIFSLDSPNATGTERRWKLDRVFQKKS